MLAVPATALLTLALSGGASATGRPPGPPPAVGGVYGGGPPPAWIEAPGRSFWLAYGSYCWTNACVDFVPPAMRTDIPSLLVRRGASIRIHFGFLPRHVTIERSSSGFGTRLQASRVIAWRVYHSGLLGIGADASRFGAVSYLFRVRFR